MVGKTEEGGNEETEDYMDSERHLTITKPLRVVGRVGSHQNMMNSCSFLSNRIVRKVDTFALHKKRGSGEEEEDVLPSMQSAGWDCEFKLDYGGSSRL